MKKTVITEALSPLDKMKAANAGTRNQNWKACSDQKLKDYYKICLDNNLVHAQNLAEAEIKGRLHWEWLAPRANNIHLLNITYADAQYLWQERATCHRVIQTALDQSHQFGDLYRPSEYLLKAYMLIKCMDHETDFKMMEIWIKNFMSDQPYYNLIPSIANQMINQGTAAADIATAIAKVKYN